ncbi:LysR family transcriptional regulator [Cellulomonas sp. P24]|uniref:LysR family transcriptional regulator n=1 Tax=Cellulomonas sp. P24 TaxID=2885206 RepID=UPI00216B4323|nr:LysR family transcriptional regulator [Cellulomonas sp. P24]MCR6492004.1 LysR family transcriptional regulator [Cellulomonas sp. P24]
MISSVQHLMSFVAVAETGTIAEAGAVLNYSPSTIILHVQALERDLDLRLLERSGRTLDLTTAGQRLVVPARLSLLSIEVLQDIARSCRVNPLHRRTAGGQGS